MSSTLCVVLLLLSFQLVDGEIAGSSTSTSMVAIEAGYSSVILDGLELSNGVVTGFYATFGQANCPVKLQVWRRHNSLQFELFWESSPISRNTPGVQFVSVSPTFAILGGIDRLGFSSLSSASSCIAYDIRANSQTLFYKYMSGEPPLQGNIYAFASFFVNHLYGLQMEYSLSGKAGLVSDPMKTGYPTRKEAIGFQVDTTKTADVGMSSFILEGLKLKEGWVYGYKVRLEQPGCTIALQVWSPDTGNKYFLKGQTIFSSAQNGNFVVKADSSNRFAVMSDERLGFSSYHPSSSCVPYLFVSDSERRVHGKTVFFTFPSNSKPQVNQSYTFIPYQTTLLFAIELEILIALEVVTGATGSTGPQGLAGPPGIDGTPGVVGAPGMKGELGDKGYRGYVGLEGSQGIRGAKGDQGFQGMTGNRGPTGLTGATGRIGLKGKPGLAGQRGSGGQRGIQGIIGEKGPTGDTGITGATGIAPRGERGQMGVIGPIGRTGPVGDLGPIGLGGPDGSTGVHGIVGVTGPVGPMWLPLGTDYCKTTTLACMHYCESTELGPRCRCYPGYKLFDQTECQEIDECACRNGGCQYFCTNTNGSYFCHCPKGLKLSKDDRRCDDIDECKDKLDNCFSDQLCINTWTHYYCAGPFDDVTLAGETSALKGGVRLLTKNMVIGLILWMTLLTLLILTSIILLIPECSCCCSQKTYEPRKPNTEQEFYYPSFFPRINLDQGRDKAEVLGGVRSHEEGGIDNLGADHLDEEPERAKE